MMPCLYESINESRTEWLYSDQIGSFEARKSGRSEMTFFDWLPPSAMAEEQPFLVSL